MALPEGTTFEEVAQWLREQYPSAVSASLFVNYYEHEVTMRRLTPEKPNARPGDSNMRRLDGQWAR